MTRFTIHTPESAPQAAQQTLRSVRKKYGFIPNLFGIFAESPGTLDAYLNLYEQLGKTPFTPTEQQVILIAASVENNCEYCVAAHTTVSKMSGVDSAVLDAMRKGTPIANPKLQALREFTRTMVEKRGWVSGTEVQAFLDAGYTHEHMLGVILGLALKTISNYTNHIAETPLDPAFEANTWKA